MDSPSINSIYLLQIIHNYGPDIFIYTQVLQLMTLRTSLSCDTNPPISTPTHIHPPSFCYIFSSSLDFSALFFLNNPNPKFILLLFKKRERRNKIFLFVLFSWLTASRPNFFYLFFLLLHVCVNVALMMMSLMMGVQSGTHQVRWCQFDGCNLFIYLFLVVF